MLEEKIMEIMDEIEYGFPDEKGNNIIKHDKNKYDEEFYDFYYLLSPNELLEKKCGTCWDQVELERKLFEENNVTVQTYFICIYDGENLPSHSFLTYEKNNKYYWFEHSWGIYRGVHSYNSKEELLMDVKTKFVGSHKYSNKAYTLIYEFEKPKYHISCQEYYDYCETQKLIKFGELN